jgi:hypothetical protein
MGVLKMKKIVLTTILIFAATVSLSFALPISGSGTLGSFSGDFDSVYDSSILANILTVSLTNTSPAANGGFLTAFAFNIPSDFTFYGFGENSNFALLSYPVKAQPFGDDFDIGAALSDSSKPSWEGGDDPTGGIKVGNTGIFTFTLLGESISTANFFSQPDPWFVVRFRGFEVGDGDGVPIDTNTPVPEPTTMLLLGAGLIGLGFFGRKRFLK